MLNIIQRNTPWNQQKFNLNSQTWQFLFCVQSICRNECEGKRFPNLFLFLSTQTNASFCVVLFIPSCLFAPSFSPLPSLSRSKFFLLRVCFFHTRVHTRRASKVAISRPLDISIYPLRQTLAERRCLCTGGADRWSEAAVKELKPAVKGWKEKRASFWEVLCVLLWAKGCCDWNMFWKDECEQLAAGGSSSFRRKIKLCAKQWLC